MDCATLDSMDMQARFHSPERRTARSRGWRCIVPVIALLILVHQILLATPLHASIVPAAPANEQTVPGGACLLTCLPTIARVCEAGHVCATMHAVFNPPPFMPLIFLALISLAMVVPRVHFFPASPYRALWRPQRRRALLQVFLI